MQPSLTNHYRKRQDCKNFVSPILTTNAKILLAKCLPRAALGKALTANIFMANNFTANSSLPRADPWSTRQRCAVCTPGLSAKSFEKKLKPKTFHTPHCGPTGRSPGLSAVTLCRHPPLFHCSLHRRRSPQLHDCLLLHHHHHAITAAPGRKLEVAPRR